MASSSTDRNTLIQAFVEGTVSRRQFTARALAAGLSLSAVGALLSASSEEDAAAAGLPTASGARYAGPTVNLAFWNGWTGGIAPTLVPAMVKQFNAAHKNIAVQNFTMQWAQYYQKVPASVSAGQGPDVGVLHGSDIATYASQRLVLPLDDTAHELGIKKSDFAPTVFNAVTYQGHFYGLPFSVTPLGLYYNKAVLQKAGLNPETPPRTQGDYMAAMEQLKRKGVQGSWVDPFVFTGVYQFESLLWQFGGSPYSADVTKATFNSDAGVAALTWMVDLVNKGYSPRNVGQDADLIGMQNGKAAFNWNGIWVTTQLEGIPHLAWGSAPVPMIGPKRAVWSSSTHFAIYNKRGQDPNKTQAAKVFIDWFIKHSLQWAQVGELPASNAVREDPRFKKLTHFQPFVDELPYAHFETAAPGIADADATIATAVNEAVLLKKTPKRALDDAAAQANKLLAQNRQQYQG